MAYFVSLFGGRLRRILYLIPLTLACVPSNAQRRRPFLNTDSPITCNYFTKSHGGCTLTEFDRTLNQIGGETVDQTTDPVQVWAINSAASKILFSGTLILAQVSVPYDLFSDPYGQGYDPNKDLSFNPPPFDKSDLTQRKMDIGRFCEDQDWKVTVLSNESSNIITYGSADIGEFCISKKLPSGETAKYVLLVVPVAVRSAEIFHYKGGKDPQRKAPSAVAAPTTYCDVRVGAAPHPDQEPLPPATQDYPKNKPPQAGGIKPCDFYTRIGGIYTNAIGKIYNRVTQPGSSQGTITLVPAIGQAPTGGLSTAKAPSTTVSYDVQLYPSGIWGPGWIGFPVVFEKANSVTANLDSMTLALSYDIPFSAITPRLAGPWVAKNAKSELARFSIRPPDVRIQYGLELGTAWPNDMNLVAAASVRLPMVLDFHNQPSAFTFFPVAGIEGGNHLSKHGISSGTETDDILRKVAGFDTSLRVPFVVTHSFLGDKPATIDFSWRTRYLSYREPFTDFVSGIPETLSKEQRRYWRGSYVVPVSTLVSFKVTVQHGGLPPDFHYLGYTLNIGLTFANPGYSEH
jgi:hypothetical protein